MDGLYHVLRHLRSIEGGAALVSEQRGRVSFGPNVKTDAVEFITLYNSGEPEDWRAAMELYRGIVLIPKFRKNCVSTSKMAQMQGFQRGL